MTTHAAHAPHADPHADHAPGELHHHHVTSVRSLVGVLLVLLALTALTVVTARGLDLGEVGNLGLALFIAVLKASFVCAIFMHLWHDKPLNSVILFFCLITVATFLLFTMIDIRGRAALDPQREPFLEQPGMVEEARQAAAQQGAHGDEHASEADETQGGESGAGGGEASGDH